MMTYEKMKSNYETIKTFCSEYRKELTIVAGVSVESQDLATGSDYKKFMDELSIEEFVGNYLLTLMVPAGVEMYRKVLNREIGFYDFIEETCGKEIVDKCHEIEE